MLDGSRYYGCPACALELAENGKRALILHPRLCRDKHLLRYEALLRDPNASQQVVKYWLPFTR